MRQIIQMRVTQMMVWSSILFVLSCGSKSKSLFFDVSVSDSYDNCIEDGFTPVQYHIYILEKQQQNFNILIEYDQKIEEPYKKSWVFPVDISKTYKENVELLFEKYQLKLLSPIPDPDKYGNSTFYLLTSNNLLLEGKFLGYSNELYLSYYIPG